VSPTDLIEEYIGGLSARLAGPRRAKRDLLREARDGLTGTADAYAGAGLSRPEAEARAIADFGAYRQVLRPFQTELAVAQGRRTALLVAVAMPALLGASRLMWPDPNPLARAFDVLQVTAAIMAVLTLVGYGWGSRYLHADRLPAAALLTRLTGVGVLSFVAAAALVGFVVFVWGLHALPATATRPPVVVGGVALPLLMLGVARSALRCLGVSARVAPAVPGTPRSSR
jgi:hypothetical protein